MATTTTPQVLNADGTLNEEFKTQLVDLINGLIETEEVQYSEVVKQYVENQLNALESKLLNNEQWVKVKENIDAILKVFDKNADGTLTPEEILAKLGEIKAGVDKNATDIASLAQKLENNVKDLTAKVAANEQAVKAVKDQVTSLDAKIEAKAKEVQDAANTAVNAVKTELGGKVDTVQGKVTQVETKLNDVESVAKGTVTAIAGIAEAFEEAAKKIDERLAKVKAVFGLAEAAAQASSNTSSNSKANMDGDGAVV